MMSPFGLGLILTIIGFVSSADFSCNGEESYNYPVEGDCRLYYVCSKDSSKPRQEGCSRFFHNFDPVHLRCDWCWKVDCSAQPPPPPTTPPTTTSVPTTASTASPSTAASTTSTSTASPTTAPPTASSTPATSTASPTTATSTAPSTTAPPTAASSVTAPPTAAPSGNAILAATTPAKARAQDTLMINRLKRQ